MCLKIFFCMALFGLLPVLFPVTLLAQDSSHRTLAGRLDSILKEDQELRIQADSLQKKYGLAVPERTAFWKTIEEKDSVNLVKVKQILDTYGWLGPHEVGENGALALFLVVQHADLATQEKYLPLMREAVQKGKAMPRHLALLEDRVLVRQGKKQLYGSQVKRNTDTQKMEFYPIEDEPNVNKRRALMGLGPLEAYARYFGIEYTLPQAVQ
jgi:hypothetical protein